MVYRFMLAGMLLLAASSQSWGAVLSSWDFSTRTGGAGNWGPSPLAATTTAANLTGSGLVRGSGILTPAGSTAGANAWGGTDFLAANLNAAITANDFVTFSVTANAGNTVSFSDIAAYNVRRSGTGASTGQWQYQVGAGAFTNIGSAITWGANTTGAGNAQTAINLSGIGALQNVAAGTTVTFRVVNWGGSSTAGTWYLNGLQPSNGVTPDFVLNGSVNVAAVPEPTSMAMLGLASGAGLFTAYRRKRKLAAKA